MMKIAHYRRLLRFGHNVGHREPLELEFVPVRRDNLRGLKPEIPQPIPQPQTRIAEEKVGALQDGGQASEAVLIQVDQQLADTTEGGTVEEAIRIASSDDGNNGLDGCDDDPRGFPPEFLQVRENITCVALGKIGRIDTQMRAANSALELVRIRLQPKAGKGTAGCSQMAWQAGEANRLRAMHLGLQGQLDAMQALAHNPQAQTDAVNTVMGKRWGTSVEGLQRKFVEAKQKDQDLETHPSRMAAPNFE